MKAYGGVDVYIHIFLTSALVGGEWSDAHPGRFILGERDLGCPKPVGTWRTENSWLYRDSNSDPSVV
jgi:hypothetical protein